MLKKLIWVFYLSLVLSVIAAEAQTTPRRTNAPELEPRASGAALALLVGSVLLLSDLRRRRDPKRG